MLTTELTPDTPTDEIHPDEIHPDEIHTARIVDAYQGVPAGPGRRSPNATGLQPLPPALTALDPARAYRVQHAVIDRMVSGWGTSVCGYKISCTGAADRALIHAQEPVYGTLTGAHLLDSGARVGLSGANDPLAEPELLMRVVRAIPDGISVSALADHVEVAGGWEIPMSRFGGWWPEGRPPAHTLGSLIADNAVAGFVVCGTTWRRCTAAEIDSMTVTVHTPSGDAHTGSATAVCGSPLRAVVWLLGKVRAHGRDLAVGTVISTGTFTTPLRARPGTHRATFTGLAEVEVTFTATHDETGSAHHDR
ncbi:2-keto-4-pentenoate hydratase [Gordonia sp. NPDC003376]